jgi:hypothetical protein
VSRTSEYRTRLRALAAADWDAFLLGESGLPGPRANLELVQAVADEGRLEQFRRWIRCDEEYLAMCGAVGLGRVLADGADDVLGQLRTLAGDGRWRVREGVAIGLQRLGARDMAHLLAVLRPWAEGSWLERRAVVAALCEPALVRDEAHARAVLEVLDLITAGLVSADERNAAEFRVLRQALAYGWSVAIVGCPGVGKPLLEKWLACGDRDGEWVARENLTKSRLKRMDPEWVQRWANR